MNEKIYIIAVGILMLWNVCTFSLMGIDKRKAKKGVWRIPEATLLICALLCGGTGAFLGMRLFRHKTRHWYFRLLLPLFALLQIALWVWLCLKI